MAAKLRVVVWNEYVHEREDEAVRKIYPKGIHGAIAD
jgi:trehalose utilization protein